jgi:hypothetical protein
VRTGRAGVDGTVNIAGLLDGWLRKKEVEGR